MECGMGGEEKGGRMPPVVVFLDGEPKEPNGPNGPNEPGNQAALCMRLQAGVTEDPFPKQLLHADVNTKREQLFEVRYKRERVQGSGGSDGRCFAK